MFLLTDLAHEQNCGPTGTFEVLSPIALPGEEEENTAAIDATSDDQRPHNHDDQQATSIDAPSQSTADEPAIDAIASNANNSNAAVEPQISVAIVHTDGAAEGATRT